MARTIDMNENHNYKTAKQILNEHALKEFSEEHNVSHELSKLVLKACNWSLPDAHNLFYKAFQLAMRHAFKDMTLMLKALIFCDGNEEKATILVDMIENH